MTADARSLSPFRHEHLVRVDDAANAREAFLTREASELDRLRQSRRYVARDRERA
jgi:hypothetical protein